MLQEFRGVQGRRDHQSSDTLGRFHETSGILSFENLLVLGQAEKKQSWHHMKGTLSKQLHGMCKVSWAHRFEWSEGFVQGTVHDKVREGTKKMARLWWAWNARLGTVPNVTFFILTKKTH